VGVEFAVAFQVDLALHPRQPEIHRHILTIAPRRGVTDAVDTIRVKHVSGGVSTSGYKSFDQGREKFQGTAFVAPLLPVGE
jgi:hypothetical protein